MTRDHLPQLPPDARLELVRQGLEQQRTPEGQATFLLIDTLRKAAVRRARRLKPPGLVGTPAEDASLPAATA